MVNNNLLFEGELRRVRSLIHNSDNVLSEIDDSMLSDMDYRCVDVRVLVKDLNNMLDKRKSLVQDKPVIPKAFGRRLSELPDGITPEMVISDITGNPAKIWSQNAKIQHSSRGDMIFFNMGLPAVQTLVWDSEKRLFYYVRTCLGAGECLNFCYAMKNNYIMFEKKWLNGTQILNMMLNRPKDFKRKLRVEMEGLCEANINKKGIYFRWHDSGDFFSKFYMEIAKGMTDYLVGEGYPVKSYAYTKLASAYHYLDSPTFVVTFSSGANEVERLKMGSDFDGKQAIHVPKGVTAGLFELAPDVIGKGGKVKKSHHALKGDNDVPILRDKSGDEIKRVISKEYGVDVGSLLLDDELYDIDEKEGVVWNVIVLPNQTDYSATRRDVNKIFLLNH